LTFSAELLRAHLSRSQTNEEREHERAARSDERLAHVAGEFVSETRSMLHTAAQLGRPGNRAVAQRHLDDTHERVRRLSAELGLVADRDGQLVARDIVRLIFGVRQLAESNGLQADRHARHGEVIDAIAAFQLAVRRQLGVPNPQSVLSEADYLATTTVPSYAA
jgi:hypothetical protein